MNETTQQKTAQLVRILRFQLGDQDFAVKLSSVQEIVNMMSVRKIPRVPDFIEGVIHLREEIIIVVDLRKLFELEIGETTKPKIIIMSFPDKQIGFVVDDVVEIINKQNEDILEAPPVIIGGLQQNCVLGVFEENGKNIMLLDLIRSFSTLEEMGLTSVLQKELSLLIDQIN